MITDQKLLDLVKRLREHMVYAPVGIFDCDDPKDPIHPEICDEAAEMLLSLASRLRNDPP